MKRIFSPDNTRLKPAIASSPPHQDRSGDRAMKKVLLSVVFALAIAGGAVAVMSGIISASPASASPMTLSSR
jgi:hypothetical protein